MAFHVGCPITCKRICYCTLGAPKKTNKNNNVDYIAELQHFLKDPWLIRVRDGSTVQVPVPPPPPPPQSENDDVMVKRVAAVQKTAGQEVARRFDSAAFVSQEATRAPAVKELGSSNGNVMCLLCFSSELEGSENAMKMLPCTCCGKRYHKQCVTKWSQHRDLFHWSSWKCPPCRSCEVCRRTGEHNKFKFCKRCDGAIHCYCMQPPHKNVSSGPYLCSKHTKCHSCGSNVPGNGLSVRWFLGYTCCDACGRLFTKGNYCPACLKVYRDSEAAPMVCCDICQHWVHIQCDGISDEIYLQFQIDGNLPYTCPTCRGEYSQIRSLDDAVHELWKRRDEEDRDLIANLRAAAGLPTEEDIFSISPFSDDEDNGPITINWRARLAMKTSSDLSPKKFKDSGKKSSSKKHGKKKEHLMSIDDRLEVKHEEYDDPQLSESRPGDKKEASYQPEPELFPSQISESFSPGDIIGSNNEQEILKHKSVDDVTGNNVERRATVKIKSMKINDTGTGEDLVPVASKPKAIKGTKLVIHLGGRNKAITNSPKSDSSSYQKEQDLVTLSGGNEAMSQQRIGDYPLERLDGPANSDDGLKANDVQEAKGPKPRDRNIIKLGKGKSEASGLQSHRGNGLVGFGSAYNVELKKRNEVSAHTEVLPNSTLKGEKAFSRNNTDNQPDISGDNINTANKQASPALDSSLKDSRPLLKLKFKTPYQGSWAPITEEERVSVKGQRSKRKRPSSLEKPKHLEQEAVTESQDGNLMNEIMDANWILKKLGKDAIGKRVEVHQPTDDSWNKGFVSDVFEGTSKLSIELDDGRAKTLELGKQGIRFVTTQKEKRLKS